MHGCVVAFFRFGDGTEAGPCSLKLRRKFSSNSDFSFWERKMHLLASRGAQI